MRKIKEVIVVEGKYDKIKLSRLFDTSILCVDGFQIYHNKEMIELLKRLAAANGVIIFTDSDSAGFRIRNFIKNKLAGFSVKHAFIPDIYGKESRKPHVSKEGKLGVEGVPDEVIIQSMKACGATFLDEPEQEVFHYEKIEPITKLTLFRLGLYGQENSKNRRGEFLHALALPQHLSPNMLVDILNTMIYSGLLKRDILDRFTSSSMDEF